MDAASKVLGRVHLRRGITHYGQIGYVAARFHAFRHRPGESDLSRSCQSVHPRGFGAALRGVAPLSSGTGKSAMPSGTRIKYLVSETEDIQHLLHFRFTCDRRG